MVKAVWNDTVVAQSDTTEVVEGNHYFPADSLAMQYFRESETQSMCSWKGLARYYTIVVGDQKNVDAAWYYPNPSSAASNIAGRVAFWKRVKIVA